MGRRAVDDHSSVKRWRISTHPPEPRFDPRTSMLRSPVPSYLYHRDFSCSPQPDTLRFVNLYHHITAVSSRSLLPLSVTGFPVDRNGQRPGSLFASRTLPPLCPQPRPVPQPHPLLRPSEWLTTSYRRDNEGLLRHLDCRGSSHQLNPILPSPLTTPPDKDGRSQR